jgi:hypothetical protein
VQSFNCFLFSNSFPHRNSTAEEICASLESDDPALEVARSHYRGSARFTLNETPQLALIFASSTMLSILQHDTTFMFADATFWTCPRPFSQVMNIMCSYKGIIMPIFHIMMTCKASELYRQIFLRLRALFQLQPLSFNTDFEAAITKAIKAVFPTAVVHGCYFHFSQAVFRAIMGSSKLSLIYLHSQHSNPDSIPNLLIKLIGCLPPFW